MDPQRFHGPRPWARTQESGTHRATAALIFACAHLNKFSGIKKVIKCPSIKAKINFSLENHPHVWEKTLFRFLWDGSDPLPSRARHYAWQRRPRRKHLGLAQSLDYDSWHGLSASARLR